MANDDKRPTEGDTYECKQCGMGILVTADCQCESGGDGAFFSCCGQQLEKKPRAS